MFSINNLKIETNKGRVLIENLSFVLNPGDKLAIIGEEGNGKSTLLKALINPKLISEYAVVSGAVAKGDSKIGYLEQKLDAFWNDFEPIDFFVRDQISKEICFDNYELVYKFLKNLEKLGFDDKLVEKQIKIGNMSGGEKVKLQLAKIMTIDADCYFLDEPTNDLDIETLRFLEKFINGQTSPVVFISHDEMLLENVANRILHIEQLIKKSKPKFTLEKCGYKEYVLARNRAIEHQTQVAFSERREQKKKEEILKQIKEKVRQGINENKKNPSNGRIMVKKMANIKAQESKLENQELTEIPDVEEAIKIISNQNNSIPSQKKVLDVHFENLFAGEKLLANNVNLSVYGAKKIAIVGKNGCGKTTLIRKLLPVLKQTTGLKVGYFSQNYNEILDFNDNSINALLNANQTLNPRTLLGCLKFTKEEMEHNVQDLSEGQKAKLSLLKIMIEGNNVLVLDEPTRNLSPLSNPVIWKLLSEFNGSIICVSHDRKFIYEICDQAYMLEFDGLKRVEIEDLIK